MEIVLSEEEELMKKHKQERKVLQAKIQSLKKSVAKGDKKRRKEVNDETDRLQQELDVKHASELASLKPNSIVEQKTNEILIDELENMEEVPATRVSRASKRRQKKIQEEKERDKRISEQAEKNKDGPRLLEMNAIKETLEKLGLQLYNIPADGNCLYCAVNHQLEIVGQTTYSVVQLRKLTAEFMRKHKEDFLPFMYNESDEIVSEEYFESYCKEVASTKLWGGQLELRALSNILQRPIKVIQANGPPTLQGENFEGPELTLTYHRHLYRLGEHYNSTVVFTDSQEEE